MRVPAAYCGLYGLRTTHGLVDTAGVVALSPSFDTVGWFARTPGPLQNLAEILLPDQQSQRPWKKLFTLPEAEALTDAETRDDVASTVRHLGLATALLPELTEPYGGLEGLRKVYALIQAGEAWSTHKQWIRAAKPHFGTAIDHRFLNASLVTDDEVQEARNVLSRFRTDLRTFLGEDGVLVLPSTSGPAPLVGEDETRVDHVRQRTMRLTCLAGLAGLPQVNVPFRTAQGLPRGVGILGPAGSDRALIQLAARATGGL